MICDKKIIVIVVITTVAIAIVIGIMVIVFSITIIIIIIIIIYIVAHFVFSLACVFFTSMESWYNWYDWPGHGNNRGMHGSAWSANTWHSGEWHATAASASHDAWQATAASASSPNQWKSSEWHATWASSPSPDQWESSEWHGRAASAPKKGRSRKREPTKWERLRNRDGLDYAMLHRKMYVERLRKAKKKHSEAFINAPREPSTLKALKAEIDKETERLYYMDKHGVIWLDSGEPVVMTDFQIALNDRILEAERKAREAPYLMQQRLLKAGLKPVNLSMCRGTTVSATMNNLTADLVMYFEGESADSEEGRDMGGYFEESSESEVGTAESAHSTTRLDENGMSFDSANPRRVRSPMRTAWFVVDAGMPHQSADSSVRAT